MLPGHSGAFANADRATHLAESSRYQERFVVIHKKEKTGVLHFTLLTRQLWRKVLRNFQKLKMAKPPTNVHAALVS